MACESMHELLGDKFATSSIEPITESLVTNSANPASHTAYTIPTRYALLRLNVNFEVPVHTSQHPP